MKKNLFLFCALFAVVIASAQDEPDKDYNYYQNSYAKLYKAYAKQPENVANNLALAEFFSDTLNPMRNYASAMRYISAAEKRYIEIVEDRDSYKEVSKLIKKKITIVLVRQKKQDIIRLAYDLLNSDTELTEGSLDNYAEAFKNQNAIMRIIDDRRINIKFQQAKEKNTLDAYKLFYDKYPATSDGETAASLMGQLATNAISKAQSEQQVDSILAPYISVPTVQRASLKRKSAIAYAILEKEPSRTAYKAFLSKYPGSDEYSLVLDKMDQLLQDDFNQLATPQQYADFAIENPENPLAEKAIENIKKMIAEEHDIKATKIYMETFPLDVSYNEIYLEYYKWHTEEGNKAPIEVFYENHPDFPYPMAIEDALYKADKIDSININMPFREQEFKEWASKVYHLTGKKVSFVALQRTLQQFIANKQWNKIPERIDFFSLSFEDNCIDEVAELRSIVEAPDNSKIVFTPVVRPAYDMIHPVMHPNGKQIFFNRTVKGGIMEIHSAQLTNGKKGQLWRSSGPVIFTNIENNGLYIYSLYNGGNNMLLGYGGDIMYATLDENGWTVIETLPEPVNTPYYDYDAFMLPDGSGILLASDRPDGHNLQPSRSYFHGDTALASDIYFIPRNDNGTWGEAVNLGINVNSPYMECSPVLSDDMKTLYFITDGRGGLGYGDIYYTTRDNTNDWRHWATPTNYGKEANSGFNEYSVTDAGDNKNLIVCSNAHGRYGCYSTTALHTVNRNLRNVTVTAKHVGMTVSVVDIETQSFVNTDQPIERESQWNNTFYANKQYLLLAACNGLFIPGLLFSPAVNSHVTPTVYEEYDLLDLTLAGSDGVPLPAIMFENDRSQLCSFSQVELNHLADFLLRNNDLSIEVTVNVKGDDDTFCFNMSQARGQEIKKALINRGVEADRIAFSGFGNSKTKRNTSIAQVSVKFFSDL